MITKSSIRKFGYIISFIPNKIGGIIYELLKHFYFEGVLDIVTTPAVLWFTCVVFLQAVIMSIVALVGISNTWYFSTIAVISIIAILIYQVAIRFLIYKVKNWWENLSETASEEDTKEKKKKNQEEEKPKNDLNWNDQHFQIIEEPQVVPDLGDRIRGLFHR